MKYLKYFPPPTQRDEMPRTEVYNAHRKKLPHRHEREAYFNMLPEVAFQEKLERDQEKDYLTLTHSEFKTCCVRLEEQDKKDREAKLKARQAAKRGAEDSFDVLRRAGVGGSRALGGGIVARRLSLGLRKDTSVSSGGKGWSRRALRYGGSLLLGETLQREVELLLQCCNACSLAPASAARLLLQLAAARAARSLACCVSYSFVCYFYMFFS